MTLSIRRDGGDLAGFQFQLMKVQRTRFLIYRCTVWVVHIMDTIAQRDYKWQCTPSGLADLWAVTLGVARQRYAPGYATGGDALRAAERMTTVINPFDWRLNGFGWALVFLLSIALTAYFISR